MGKAREFAKRRKSVANTRKITHTMEMVATAKFKHAMDRAVATRPYADKLSEMLGTLAPACEDLSHPLLETRPEKKALLLVVTANRGLCGGYNANVLREAANWVRERKAGGVDVELHVSGKRGLAYMDYRGWECAGRYTDFSENPTYETVTGMGNGLIDQFATGEVDSVSIAFMRFQSAARQTPTVAQVLPLVDVKPAGDAPEGDEAAVGGDVLFDPDPRTILEELLPLYVRTSFFSAYLDAVVSEHIARMIAMKAATDAAKEMMKELNRAYNRARQSEITNQIAEIVGGAAALD